MKTEKEKMMSGKLYLPFAADLVADRNRAHDIMFEYNNMLPSEHEKRNNIIRKLFGSAGDSFLIESDFRCDYGYNIHLGENFYANFGCVILDGAPVRFGDNVLLAPNVCIYTAGHPLDMTQRNEGIEYAYPVNIGNNVWIGGNTVIVPGVSIGNNTVRSR